MTTKTTIATNDAGRSSPHPSEAHQRAVGQGDIAALQDMLKNPAPTIRRAARQLIAELGLVV